MANWALRFVSSASAAMARGELRAPLAKEEGAGPPSTRSEESDAVEATVAKTPWHVVGRPALLSDQRV